MRSHSPDRRVAQAAAVLLAVQFAAACAAAPAPEPVQVYGPDTSHAAHGRAADAPPAAARAAPRPMPDAEFLRHMIAHHAQAIVMSKLVPARSQRTELRLLAERITVSQRDEIAQMMAWLRTRNEPVPVVDSGGGAHAAHGAADHAGMPGMLTAAELASLEAARGAAFDRLFLGYMIRHHQGAITMVTELFRNGGGQESQVYAIASEIESDQRMEIARMERLLAVLPSVAPGSR